MTLCYNSLSKRRFDGFRQGFFAKAVDGWPSIGQFLVEVHIRQAACLVGGDIHIYIYTHSP